MAMSLPPSPTVFWRAAVSSGAAALAFSLVLLATPAVSQADDLSSVRRDVLAGRYTHAAAALADASTPVGKKSGTETGHLLRAKIALMTGKYAEAATLAKTGARRFARAKRKFVPLGAEALMRQGKLDAAIKVLESVENDSDAHRAHVLLGAYRIRVGDRTGARAPLMAVIAAYNDDRINDKDPAGLTLVGRAAYLLRAYRDANDAFNEAEKAGGKKRVETLLSRAELFLDRYDPGHAAQVVSEAAALAPGHPQVHVMTARVKLAQALDFAAAEKAVNAALAIDPLLAEAYYVRAGLALRTMDIAAADAATKKGLETNPRNLELLSMRAATRFLAEDRTAFRELEKKVLGLNSGYSRFYNIVSEYAEWEHRYDDIVVLMNRATSIDDRDAKAYAQLGLNLIRNGDDKKGVEALQKAWRRDKFNVRVFNTLNLFEKTIPKEYVSVEGTIFRLRYHKKERRMLQRYVPRMLEAAWSSMVKRYGFSPKTPVSIELYADSQHFGVRTSGLPHAGIQGVCFGRTLAAMSPAAGEFNWGMILWHELAHVFHIQRSKNRVPRWFTEGMAEYETIIARQEWQREEHVALFEGLRDNRVPKVANFNRAFTHVDRAQDITMAYFAASQLAVFMVEEFGFSKVASALAAWGEGKPSATVISSSLGVSETVLDQRYRKWLEKQLGRYRKQFMPDLRRPDDLVVARKELAAAPSNPDKLYRVALGLLATGKEAEARATLALALQAAPSDANANYLQAKIALGDRKPKVAFGILKKMIKAGHDGYAVQLKLADLAQARKDTKAAKKHLMAAHAFDRSQAEPMQAFYDLALAEKDEQSQLHALRQIVRLEQHDRGVYAKLLRLLVKKRLFKEAAAVGESAIYIDVMSPEIHVLYGRALAHTGRHVSAIFELNSALIGRPKPAEAARIYRIMAKGYEGLGHPKWAAKALMLARRAASQAQPEPR